MYVVEKISQLWNKYLNGTIFISDNIANKIAVIKSENRFGECVIPKDVIGHNLKWFTLEVVKTIFIFKKYFCLNCNQNQ